MAVMQVWFEIGRRKKVLSKNLRVIFLSVLVVVFSVSSAFALNSYTMKFVDATEAARLAALDPDEDGIPDPAQDSEGNAPAAGDAVALDDNDKILARYDATNDRLLFDADGEFSFADDYARQAGAPEIDNIAFAANGAGTDYNVHEVVFYVPAPYPNDEPARGTRGDWIITWPAQVKNSSGTPLALHDAKQDKRFVFSIEKGGTNSAILPDADLDFSPTASATPNVGSAGGYDFTLNVPVRVNSALGVGAVQITVNASDGNTVTLGREAEIFQEQGIQNYPTGFTTATGTYNIARGGELIVRNTWALRGSKLIVRGEDGVGSVAASKRPTLTLDLPAGTVHDLRGRISSASGSDGLEGPDRGGHANSDTGTFTYNRSGASLFLTGPTVLNVLSDMTLYGQIDPDAENTTFATSDFDTMYLVTKRGEGKLTLDADESLSSTNPRYDFEKRSIPSKIDKILVEEGTLEFAAKQTWRTGLGIAASTTNDTPEVIVSAGAKFIAGAMTIWDDSDGSVNANGDTIQPVKFSVHGEAEFGDHAIIKDPTTEIYPYENFVTFNNGLKINADDISLNVPAGGKATIKDGAFAVGTLTGEGEIVITNTIDSRDRAVLILTDSNGGANPGDSDYAANYINFKGKISGNGANVGLYSALTTRPPFSRRIFQSATVDIDNLIVYGPAQLDIDENTNLSGVKNIWLRGHRPGAANYNDDGTVNHSVAYSRLTVGKLNVIPVKEDSSFHLASLKVDGTTNPKEMGEVVIDDLDRDLNWDYDANMDLVNNKQLRKPYTDGTAKTGPRVNFTIDNLHLYANKGTNRDFTDDYIITDTTKEKGVYALRLNSTNQPSRIIVDGNNVDGDGRAADVKNIYQVEITEGSDVKFTRGDWTSDETYEPLATNNSLLVKKNAKLEIARGGKINGNLAFEPSGLEMLDLNADGDGTDDGELEAGVWPEYSRNHPYPADEDFHDTEHGGWYTQYINRYTTFATQVGKKNRYTSETGGVYSVQVTGDIKLSGDNGYGGGNSVVVMRVKPDIDIFDGIFEPPYGIHEGGTVVGQAFKMLGRAEGTNGAFVDDFAVASNPKFQFFVTGKGADTNGVSVENRTELAILELGDYSFLSDPANFGVGGAREFSIKIPFTVTIRGYKFNVEEETSEVNGQTYRYIEVKDDALGMGKGKYYFAVRPEFIYYEDGEESDEVGNNSEVDTDDYYLNENFAEYVSNDVTGRLEPDIRDDEQYLRFIGTSKTTFDKTTPIRIKLDFVNITNANLPLGMANTFSLLNGSVPAYRTYEFSRTGGGNGGSDTPTPVSPDNPAPVSPDNPAPVSPDNPAPVSPDNPAPGPDNPTPAPATFSIEHADSSTMDDGDELVAGRSYTIVFEATGLSDAAVRASATTTWAVSGNTNGVSYPQPATGNTFTIVVTPSAVNEEGQTFMVTATNGDDTATYEVSFTVAEEDLEGFIQPSEAAGFTVTGDHNDVKAGYRVTFPSGVTADPDNVFIPAWLRLITNDDDEVTGVEFNDAVTGFAQGTAATVTVEGAENEDGDEFNYQWNVVYGVESSVTPTPGPTPSNDVPVPGPISEDISETVSSSSSSGCDAGFGAFALLFAAPLFLRRRRS